MSTTDNKENNKEIKTEALPAKKVSASETHQYLRGGPGGREAADRVPGGGRRNGRICRVSGGR